MEDKSLTKNQIIIQHSPHLSLRLCLRLTNKISTILIWWLGSQSLRKKESKALFIDLNFIRGKGYSKLEQDAQVDCAEKLTNAKRDIKVLNYQLTHIVAGINDKNNTLQPRHQVDIEVMEETHMTYKVHARNQYCPIRVQI